MSLFSLSTKPKITSEAISIKAGKHFTEFAKENIEQTIKKEWFQEPASIHIVSLVQWSVHDLIDYIFRNISGKAHLYFTTWAISENPIRKILKLKAEGYINELHCLLDKRVISQCPAAWQMARNNLGNIVLTDIHAKVFVIENEKYSITCTMTANFTNKKRIEKYVIDTRKEIAEYDKKWIINEIENVQRRTNS